MFFSKTLTLDTLRSVLQTLMPKSTPPQREDNVVQNADVPDYLRRDVGLLPRTPRARAQDPPRVDPLRHL